MFAGQSDVIIRSDVTSGVHPPNAFLGTVVACHEYTIVIFFMREEEHYCFLESTILSICLRRCESAHF